MREKRTTPRQLLAAHPSTKAPVMEEVFLAPGASSRSLRLLEFRRRERQALFPPSQRRLTKNGSGARSQLRPEQQSRWRVIGNAWPSPCAFPTLSMTNPSGIACDVGHLAQRFPSHGGCAQRERREWLCRHLNAETAQGPRCGSPASGRPCLRPTALMRRGFPSNVGA